MAWGIRHQKKLASAFSTLASRVIPWCHIPIKHHYHWDTAAWTSGTWHLGAALWTYRPPSRLYQDGQWWSLRFSGSRGSKNIEFWYGEIFHCKIVPFLLMLLSIHCLPKYEQAILDNLGLRGNAGTRGVVAARLILPQAQIRSSSSCWAFAWRICCIAILSPW